VGKVLLLIALATAGGGYIKAGFRVGAHWRNAMSPTSRSRPTTGSTKQNTCRMSRHNVQQLEQAERSGADVWSLHGDQKKLRRAEIYAALEENRRLVAANCTR
jgi:hypothetical protein